MSESVYEPLAWDSEFFGLRIGRVDLSNLDGESAVSALKSAAAQPVDCLYVLVPARQRTTIRAAENLGARLVDLRLTLMRSLGDNLRVSVRDGVQIRVSNPSDVPHLMDIARTSHRDSRFYADLRLPNDRCDALYARWIEKRCEEEPEAVLVAERESDPVGYLSLGGLASSDGLIDLVAVAPNARGEGIGMQLTAASLRRLAESGSGSARVVTQGGNTPALRLYGAVGFVTDSVDLWYHYWPDEAGPPGPGQR